LVELVNLSNSLYMTLVVENVGPTLKRGSWLLNTPVDQTVDQTKAKADLLSTQIGSSGGVDNLYNEKMRLGGDGRR
jgi:hypothetical protein